jgi:hypothetical protein
LLLNTDDLINRETIKGARAAARRLAPEVVKTAKARMPSGYAPVLVPALEVQADVSRVGKAIRVDAAVAARGRRKFREVPTIDKGVLDHPVFGVWRKRGKGPKGNRPTMVKPHFASDPIDQLVGRVDAAAKKARDRAADAIVRE